MTYEWQIVDGTAWIVVPRFGEIAPQQDIVAGGRRYSTAKLANGEYARVKGDSISGGPEPRHFEFEEPFLLADGDQNCIEVMVSPLKGGRHGIKYRPGHWPSGENADGDR